TAVVTVSGLPGVGKTALAVEWGYRAAALFPGGQLYLNLRGFDAMNEPLSSDEALRVLMTSLGVAETNICHGLEARVGQYRTLVSTLRLLIVLDNAVDSDQVRPLLPAGAGSVALVVSRKRLPGLVAEVGAAPISLGALRSEESRELITLRLAAGPRSAQRSATDLEPLIDMCSGLPLALALVASRLQFEPDIVSEYATLAQSTGRRLPALASGDRSTSFAELLLCSLDGLSSGAQRCFSLIGLGISSELSVAELASLSGCGIGEVRALAAELSDASMVQAAEGGRLALHDLIWEFVVDRARSEVSPDEASRCRKRLLDHLIQGSVAATAQFAPYRKRPALPAPTDGIVVEAFASADEARAWMSSMLGTGVVAVEHATEWGFPREAAWLADGISAYLDIQGRWDDLLAVATSALRAGQALGDPQIQGLAYRSLAIAQARTGDAEQAEQSVCRALSSDVQQSGVRLPVSVSL
ncbi:MAG TPA: NB-ARC domain-containing protein, partial [Nocardioides sp.]|nr:NB-ARC domain-containing protein [Nocardioides sp.]